MTMRCKNRGEFHPLSLVSIGLVLMATVLGIYACSPNGSSTSGTQSGTGGTGNFEGNWVVSVSPAQSTMFQSVASTSSDIPATLSTTSVMITVTNVNGAPAPPNSTVFITCSNGAFSFRFRASGGGYDYGQPITTDNRVLSNGRTFIDFFAGFSPGTASINVTFQGSTGTATINISPTPTPTTTTTTTDRKRTL
jgi:hypothetical protein